MSTKPRRRKLALAALAVAVLLLVALDSLGMLRPHPAASELVAQMAEAWERAPSYYASISIGTSGDSGENSEPSRQWYDRRKGLIVGARDQMGAFHMERWTDKRWDYYHGGAAFAAEFTLANPYALPFSRWRVSGIATMDDLVRAIQSAGKWIYIGRTETSYGETWIIECQPALPTSESPSHPAADEFYQRMFGRPWRVWIASKIRMPIHVVIGPDQQAHWRVGVESLEIGSQPPGGDWKTVAGLPGTVKETIRSRCDLAAPDSIEAARRIIRDRVFVWRKALFPPADAG